jgi:hypothetical protein
MDQEQKRLIVLGTNGKPIKQFFSSKFVNLKDFFADEKTIYLLDGNKIYRLSF